MTIKFLPPKPMFPGKNYINTFKRPMEHLVKMFLLVKITHIYIPSRNHNYLIRHLT